VHFVDLERAEKERLVSDPMAGTAMAARTSSATRGLCEQAGGPSRLLGWIAGQVADQHIGVDESAHKIEQVCGARRDGTLALDAEDEGVSVVPGPERIGGDREEPTWGTR
jgi:hypothetical protein